MKGLFYTLLHKNRLQPEFWILFWTFVFSNLYHWCDFAGDTLCSNVTLWNRFDHLTAEFLIPMMLIYLTPFWKDMTTRWDAYWFFLYWHAIVQFSQFYPVVWQVRPQCSVSPLTQQQVIYGALVLVVYLKWHSGNKLLTLALILASVGITFYFLTYYRIFPYAHTFWHVFSMIAVWLALWSIDPVKQAELTKEWDPFVNPWIWNGLRPRSRAAPGRASSIPPGTLRRSQ